MIATTDSAYPGSSVETTSLTGRKSVAWHLPLPSWYPFPDHGGMEAGLTPGDMFDEIYKLTMPRIAGAVGI